MRAQVWAIVAIAVLAGCGGGGGSSSVPGTSAAMAGSGTAVFTIVIPATTSQNAQRSLKYISPSTKSVAISVNGAASQIVNVSPGSPGCTTSSAGTTCTVGVTAPAGNVTFVVTMFDQPGGTGNNLGSGTQTATINPGQAFNVSITPGGNISKLFISIVPSVTNAITVSAVAQDAAGNTIVGPFASPVTVSASSGVTLSGTSLASSTATVTATGSGSGTVTLTSGSLNATASGPLTTLSTIPLPMPSAGAFIIAKGPDNNMWFTENGPSQLVGNNTFVAGTSARIARFNVAAGTITEFPLSNPSATLRGIVSGPDGNLWFGEVLANKMGSVTTSGQITEYPLPAATPNPSTGLAMRGPSEPVVGSDGALWFGEPNGRTIGRITTAGTITEFPLPKPTGGTIGTPLGLALGSDGAIWFTERVVNRIGRITTAGVITEFSVPTANAQPRQLALGSDGAMWFSEFGSSVIGEFPPSVTGGIGRITTSGQVTEFRLPASQFVQAVTLGPDGNIWFTDGGGNAIGKITPAGVITEYPTPPQFGSSPTFIAVMPDGSFFFDDQSTNSLNRFVLGAGWMPMPSALQIPGTGSTSAQLLVLAESGNSGPFTVTSSSPSVATVAPSTFYAGASYMVTGVALGKTTITIVDAKNRMATVPVDVNGATVTLQGHAHALAEGK